MVIGVGLESQEVSSDPLFGGFTQSERPFALLSHWIGLTMGPRVDRWFWAHTDYNKITLLEMLMLILCQPYNLMSLCKK